MCEVVVYGEWCADPADTFSALQTKVSKALTAALRHSSTGFLQVAQLVLMPKGCKNRLGPAIAAL